MGQLTIFTSPIIGQSGSKRIGPLNISAANPILQVYNQGYAVAGTATIPVPIGTTAVVIAPPLDNMVPLNIVTSPLPISPNMPTVLTFAPFVGAGQLQVSAAQTLVGTVEFSFF